MSNAVQVRRLDSGVALLTLDLPDKKVNVLSESLMSELNAAIDQLAADKSTKGLIIVSGKTDNFIAGANIEEIQALQNQPAIKAYEASLLGKSIFAKIAALPFPTVAAINGTCLGGGTEMSLACTYRLASADAKTKIGVPEVMLGFIPGWGGTVRLPRLVGLQTALEMITTGSNLDAKKAWRVGLVDEVVDADKLVARAESLLLSGHPKRYQKPLKQRLTQMALEGNPVGRALFFSQATKLVKSKSKGYLAPNEAVKVIQKSFQVPLDEAFRIESEAFGRLAVSQVSKNLVGVFFAQTESKKVPEGVTASVDVKKVGVLGAGVMGAGIAQSALYAGYEVVLKDIKQEFLDRGLTMINGLFNGLVEKRKMTRQEADAILARLKPTLDYADMSDCDLVIEAVAESMYIKRMVRNDLEKVIAKPFVFATNTSSLSVDEIVHEHKPATEREKAIPAAREPQNIVGLHFFNPVHKMPLVEVVDGEKTSPETLACAKQFALKLGKTTVVTADSPGFVVNRILAPYMLEAIRLFEAGVPAEDIEKAMTEFGMPMGPLALLDEVGLDICAHVVDTLHGALGERLAPPAILSEIKSMKLLGKKGGKGIYLFDAPDGKRIRDKKTKKYVFNPDVLAAVKAPKSPKSKTEIQDRLVLVMVNEAARCIEEGVITDPAQLDLAMIFGTGFPPFRGGVLKYADERGLLGVYEKLSSLWQVSGGNYEPDALLAEKAKKRASFYR